METTEKEEVAKLEAQQPGVREACQHILTRGDLASKLTPVAADGATLLDSDVTKDTFPSRPVRGAGLEMASGAATLPRPGALRSPHARAVCLARFAHHELQAVELFAWALLRWPELPQEMAAGWLHILGDEQRHARAYLDRLEAQGFAFASFAPHSDYLWKNVDVMETPAAFLAAVGLTFEQANLDFSLLYRDAFREAGDEESARVCQEIHDDEVGHVAFAASWLEVLQPGGDAIARYEASVPFPFSAARAKGRRFDVAGRRKAGLSDAFIEHVRTARSSQERG
ncbi:MAG: ferritin-like domain-containing protein [bacterium]|nr:ferritin-like domain-containing protein [bacterium]